jgi:hypothetical protein
MSLGEVEPTMAEFVGALADARAAMSLPEWRRAVSTIVADPVHALVLQDPCTFAAFRKVRGYPGDADTLDFIYRRRSIPSHTTPLGRRLLQFTTELPVACAVRARTRYLADLIAERVADASEVTVVSIACGHMRELELLPSLDARNRNLIGIDHDPETLGLVTRTFGSLVTTRQASVRQLLAHPETVPRANLIYAAGLFDYLEDRAAALLIRRLRARLTPHGTLVVTNLTPLSAEIAYMESVMDWWMVYRDEEALRALAGGAGAGRVRMRTLIDGRVSCMELTG